MKLKIYRNDKSVPLPKRMTNKSAGLDVYCAETITIPYEKVVLISTGLIIQPPENTHIKLFIRSSIAVKKQITLVNNVGIIDEDYCGPKDELKIAVYRLKNGDEFLPEITIEKGTRIGQIIFERTDYPNIEWDEQETPDFAGRTRGGFGSTD